jgi:hypothetical protein
VALAYVVNSPYLVRLARLELFGAFVGPLGAAALADSRAAETLTHLDLSHNQLIDKGVMPLARSPYLRRLTQLNLDNTYFTGHAVRALARSPILGSVVEPRLRISGLDEGSAETLLTSPYLGPHTTLFLERRILKKSSLRDRFPGRVKDR